MLIHSKGIILKCSGPLQTTQTMIMSPSLSSITSRAPLHTFSVRLGVWPHHHIMQHVHFCPWAGRRVQWEERDLWCQRDLVSHLIIIYCVTVGQCLNFLNLCFHVFKTRKKIHLLKLWVLKEALYAFKSHSAMSNTFLSHWYPVCPPLALSSFKNAL